MRLIQGIVILLLYFAWGGFLTAQKKDLARVAILTFEDQTGTKNYGYLPGSLTEAVDKSLQKKFDYVREEPAKSEAAYRVYTSGKIMNAAEAAAFAQRNQYDIVIYGFITVNRTTVSDNPPSFVVVKTFVSLGTPEKFRALPERSNPADATIFSLAEKVADDIVAEMTAVAKEQGAGKKTPAATEKLELKKDQESATSWDGKKWHFSLEAGFTGPLSEGESLKNGLGATLRLNRDFWRRAYAGAELGAAFTGNAASSCGGSNCTANGQNFEAIYGAAALGYAFYPGNRWRLFCDAGFGTARGSFREDPAGEKNAQTRFILRAALGADFLLFPAVSLGVGIRVMTFPGSGESFAFAQPGIRFAYVF